MILCPEIKQKQPRDRKTSFETLSLPVAKILSPVARQAPTKPTSISYLIQACILFFVAAGISEKVQKSRTSVFALFVYNAVTPEFVEDVDFLLRCLLIISF